MVAGFFFLVSWLGLLGAVVGLLGDCGSGFS